MPGFRLRLLQILFNDFRKVSDSVRCFSAQAGFCCLSLINYFISSSEKQSAVKTLIVNFDLRIPSPFIQFFFFVLLFNAASWFSFFGL